MKVTGACDIMNLSTDETMWRMEYHLIWFASVGIVHVCVYDCVCAHACVHACHDLTRVCVKLPQTEVHVGYMSGIRHLQQLRTYAVCELIVLRS